MASCLKRNNFYSIPFFSFYGNWLAKKILSFLGRETSFYRAAKTGNTLFHERHVLYLKNFPSVSYHDPGDYGGSMNTTSDRIARIIGIRIIIIAV
jgi:hypothetical protein